MTYHTVNVHDNTKKLLSRLAKRDNRPIGIITQEAVLLYAKTFTIKREPVPSKAGRPKAPTAKTHKAKRTKT